MNFEQQIIRMSFESDTKIQFQAGYRSALLEAKKIAQKADTQTLTLINALVDVFPKGWQEKAHKECHNDTYMHNCRNCKSFLRKKISEGVRLEVGDLESFVFKNIS